MHSLLTLCVHIITRENIERISENVAMFTQGAVYCITEVSSDEKRMAVLF